jgi:hypothetical protein
MAETGAGIKILQTFGLFNFVLIYYNAYHFI